MTATEMDFLAHTVWPFWYLILIRAHTI